MSEQDKAKTRMDKLSALVDVAECRLVSAIKVRDGANDSNHRASAEKLVRLAEERLVKVRHWRTCAFYSIFTNHATRE